MGARREGRRADRAARRRRRDHVLRHRRRVQRRPERGDHRQALRKLFEMREEYVVATKVHGQTMPGENGRGLSRKHIMASIDASLKRLELDYVDLYQIHRWDPRTPIGETMEALHDVVKAGKARYIGASSMYAWQFAKAQAVASTRVRVDAESLQPRLPRGGARDDPAVPRPGRRGAAVEPAGTGAAGRQPHARRRAPDHARQHRPVRRLPVQARDATSRSSIARWRSPASAACRARRSRSPGCCRSPGVTAPIVGATKLEHLEDALAAEKLTLSESEVSELEEPYVPHAISGH